MATNVDKELEDAMRRIEEWKKAREKNKEAGLVGVPIMAANPELIPIPAAEALEQNRIHRPSQLSPIKRPSAAGSRLNRTPSTRRSGSLASSPSASQRRLGSTRRTVTARTTSSGGGSVTAGSRLAQSRRERESRLRDRREKGKSAAVDETEVEGDDVLADDDRERVRRLHEAERKETLEKLREDAEAEGTQLGAGRRERAALTAGGSRLQRNRTNQGRFADERRRTAASLAEQEAAGVGGPADAADGADPVAAAAAARARDIADEEEAIFDEADFGDAIAPLDRLYTIVKPVYVSRGERGELEGEVFDVVSDDEVEFGGATAAELADEGLYVGARPRVSDKNMRKMLNRLYDESTYLNSNWFKDGVLVAEPDPIKKEAERPTRVPLGINDDPLVVVRRHTNVDVGTDGFQPQQQLYEFTVAINGVVFEDHPLFSEEDLLTRRIESAFDEYILLANQDKVGYWKGRIENLKANLQEEILAGPPADDADDGGLSMDASFGLPHAPNHKAARTPGAHTGTPAAKHKKRVARLGADLREARRNLDRFESRERELVAQIESDWELLQNIRRGQGYTATELCVEVVVEELDGNDVLREQRRRRDEVDERLSDAMDANIAAFTKAEEEYHRRRQVKEAKAQVRAEKERRLEAKREARQASRALNAAAASGGDNGAGVGVGDDDDGDSDSESELSSTESELGPPPRQEPFNADAERAQIEAHLNETKGRPGEPKRTTLVVYAAQVSDDVPAEEAERQRKLRSTQVNAKIVCNGRVVTSRSGTLEYPSCRVRFNDWAVTVQVYAWPDQLALNLEYSGLFSSAVAPSIRLPVAGEAGSVNEVRDTYDIIPFRGTAPIEGGDGNVEEESGTGEDNTRYTRGRVEYLFVWARKDGVVVAPKRPRNVVSSLVPDSFEKLREWAESADVNPESPETVAIMSMLNTGADLTQENVQAFKDFVVDNDLDPNDPRNAEVLALLKEAQNPSQAASAFRTRVLPGRMAIPKPKREPWRLQLLRRREVAPISHQGPVPLDERDITPGMFQAPNAEADTQDDGPYISSQFVRKLRAQTDAAASKLHAVEFNKEHYDVVREMDPPDISVFVDMIVNVLRPRRRLRPRKKKVVAKATPPPTCNLHIKIVRGHHVPVRRPADMSEAERQLQIQQIARGTYKPPSDVMTYVEVRFQDEWDMTRAKSGLNPHWNEDVTLKVTPPGGSFTPENVAVMQDRVYFNIFDRKIEMREGTDVIVTNNFIGSFSLPFAAIYRTSVIQGHFLVDVPSHLANYVRHERRPGVGGPLHETHQPTYLYIFAALQPPLPVTVQAREKIGSHEDDALIEACLAFNAIGKKYKPARMVHTLVADHSGMSIFVCRYIAPLEPPPGITTRRQMLRYVSLIPNINDAAMFKNRTHVWATADDFLQHLAGDEEEHAILLCSYFLHRGDRAFLVLGTGVPEGFTSYVLTRNNDNTIQLWNAHAGTVFYHSDPNIPIRSIGCVISQRNVYANIQSSSNPNDMQFDFNNKSHWKPLFSSSDANIPPSVQPDRLEYAPTRPGAVMELRQRLERLVLREFEEWRLRLGDDGQTVTRTNYLLDARSKLRTLVPKFEPWILGETDFPRSDVAAAFRALSVEWDVVGFPLNMTYTDDSLVLDALRNTGLHRNKHPDVQFGYAFHVHGYPGGVMSVWIYFCSFTPKR